MTTIFTSQTPGTTSGDSQVNCGVAFTIDSAGYQSTGGRYYKSTQPYDGLSIQMGLWAGSTLIASGSRTQSAGDPTGWIDIAWTSAVSLSTGVTYTVAYLTPGATGYSYTAGGLTSAITNAPISSLATGGRYTYGASLAVPTTTATTNFFADVVVVPDTGGPTYPPITLRAAGTSTLVTAVATTLNPAVPAGATTGDLSVLCVEAKPYNTTITTPSGWTKIGEATNGTTAAATDVGSTKVAMFVRESATAGAIGAMTLTSADTACAVIHTYAKGSAYSWDYSAFTSGGDTVNDANYSATGGVLPVAVEDWVLCATAVNTDLAVSGPTAQAINGLTGATLTKTVRTAGTSSGQGIVTTGTDSRLMVTDAYVTAGSSVTAPTFTYTLGSSSSGTSMWLRLRQTLPWWVPGKRTQQAIRRAANW